MKNILIKTTTVEELKMVEDFIKEKKLQGFIVQDSKPTEAYFLDEVVRVLVPILPY